MRSLVVVCLLLAACEVSYAQWGDDKRCPTRSFDVDASLRWFRTANYFFDDKTTFVEADLESEDLQENASICTQKKPAAIVATVVKKGKPVWSARIKVTDKNSAFLKEDGAYIVALGRNVNKAIAKYRQPGAQLKVAVTYPDGVYYKAWFATDPKGEKKDEKKDGKKKDPKA